MLNVAIAGYGNLGKSLEKEILSDKNLNLTAIFSRRNIDNPKRLSFDEAARHTTDVILLALGSYADIAENVGFFRNFHTVDSYDTHAEIPAYKALLRTAKPNTISLCAVGWDPGILSLARGLFSVAQGKTATFWGSGISQGHSNALRSVKGVLDAVEITQPCESAKQSFWAGKSADANAMHHRLCYVACVEADKQRIEREIRNMPHYFAGQNVDIVFCTPAEVRSIKRETEHAGEVLCLGKGFRGSTRVEMDSNTDFTAKIMLAYAKAVPQLQRDGYLGPLTPFDIPLKYVADENLI